MSRFQVNQIYDDLIWSQTLADLFAISRFGPDHYDFALLDHILEIAGQERTNVRNHLFDILPVRSGQASQVNIGVPNANVAAFSKKSLDHLHLGAFPKVVGTCFETQAKDRNVLLFRPQHGLKRPVYMFAIATEYVFNELQRKIKLFRAMRQSTQILR
jgi:hypothetical protein